MTDPTPILKLSGVTKRFGETVALDGVNLELHRGQVHALVGENGAGKSTLMAILAGALQPGSGAIWLGGETYSPAAPVDARQRGISLIHQEPSLCPHLSVSENIVLGGEPASRGWIDRREERRKVETALKLFDHPEIAPERKVSQLSISARQIVEICRALSFPSDIILMDEPTSALQQADVKRLFELIRQMAAQNKSVIYISHFLEEVREAADWCTVLRDGKDVAAGPLSALSDDQLISAMVGRPVENLFPTRSSATVGEKTILEAKDLAAPPEVAQASFQLRRGEILGIAGLAGSGRTRLVRGLLGLDAFQSGRVRVGGEWRDASRLRPDRQIRSGVGYVSEDRKGEGLGLSLSVSDNVTMTRLNSCSRWGWLNLTAQRVQARQAARPLQIRARSMEQTVDTLSGGNQQKAALARLLHQDAEILLLDEPTRGIDIGSKAEIYRVISQLAARGKGILLVSSYLPELFGLCHRLAVMSRGTLSEARSVDQWTPESVLKTALAAQGQS